MIKKYGVSIATFVILVGGLVVSYYTMKPQPVSGADNPLLSSTFWQTATPDDVNKIIATGADVNALGKLDKTPLMVSAQHATNPDSLMVLLNNGADRTLWSNEQKRAVNYALENPNIKGTKAFKAINNPLYSKTR